MRYAVLVSALCFLFACSSSMPPIPEAPEVEVQEVKIIVECIIPMDPPPRDPLPDYPAFDGSDPEGWAKSVRRIYKLREVKKDAYIDALLYLIGEHNKLEPKCSE